MHSPERAEAAAIAAVLRDHDWISRCWLSAFVVDKQWERLPSSWRDALLSLSDEELHRLPSDLPLREEWPPPLRRLLSVARHSFALAAPTAAPPPPPPPPRDWLVSQVARVRNMSPKKRHEVLRLAPLVARLAAERGVATVVDVGSGYGYLSLVLAFHHGLHVVGVEADASNASAARRRAALVKARMEVEDRRRGGLAPRGEGGGAEEKAEEGAPVFYGGGSFSSLAVTLAADARGGWVEALLSAQLRRLPPRAAGGFLLVGLHACGDLSPTLLRLFSANLQAGHTEEGGEGAEGNIGVAEEVCVDAEEGCTSSEGKREPVEEAGRMPTEEGCMPTEGKGEAVEEEGCIPTEGKGEAVEEAGRMPTEGKGEAVEEEGCMPTEGKGEAVEEEGCIPTEGKGEAVEEAGRMPTEGKGEAVEGKGAAEVVERVSSAGLLVQLAIEALAPHRLALRVRVALARPSCVGVVSVGCCYHQLTEASPRWKEDARHVRAPTPNFPMSAYVRSLGVRLGEKARHLALQNVHACVGAPLAQTRAASTHHFHRCLLECRLRQLHPPRLLDAQELPREGNVGPLPRCDGYGEYARRALPRLGVAWGEEEAARAAEAEAEHAWLERPLHAFLMLRAALARPIERLLLLDRLLFLQERGGKGVRVQLVPLFDPLISPRNTAVVACVAEEEAAPATRGCGVSAR